MKNLIHYINEALIKNHIDKPKTPDGYVDLGLPSGTLWAIDSYDEYGDSHFYTHKTEFTYRELKNVLKTCDVPTKEQWQELYDYCEIDKLGENNGKLKLKFTNNNSALIFNTDNYWTSSQDANSDYFYVTLEANEPKFHVGNRNSYFLPAKNILFVMNK